MSGSSQSSTILFFNHLMLYYSRHIARQHSPNITYFDCREHGCNYSTLKKADLSRHRRSKHPSDLDPERYVCPICGMSSSRKDNLNRHIAICTRSASCKWKEQEEAPGSVIEARNSETPEALETSISMRVLVPWPSPDSRQADREGPLREIDRFEEPQIPQASATFCTPSPCDSTSDIAFNSTRAAPVEVAHSGSIWKFKDEDELSLYEQSNADWMPGCTDAESKNSQNKRKTRTADDEKVLFVRRSQKRNRSSAEQVNSNDRLLMVLKSPQPKQYKYGLRCPYYQYDPDLHAVCSGCSFDALSHL